MRRRSPCRSLRGPPSLPARPERGSRRGRPRSRRPHANQVHARRSLLQLLERPVVPGGDEGGKDRGIELPARRRPRADRDSEDEREPGIDLDPLAGEPIHAREVAGLVEAGENPLARLDLGPPGGEGTPGPQRIGGQRRHRQGAGRAHRAKRSLWRRPIIPRAVGRVASSRAGPRTWSSRARRTAGFRSCP